MIALAIGAALLAAGSGRAVQDGAPTTAPTPAQAVGLAVEFDAPRLYVPGKPYEVHVTFTAPTDGAPAATWLFTPSAFTVDGRPLAARPQEAFVPLAPGARLEFTLDLAPHLEADSGFELGFAKGIDLDGPMRVDIMAEAPADADFDAMLPERLAEHRVLLRTTRGDMLVELWPDVAPGHVRNFLQLAHEGFYDGTLFHRVIPGFMIQGGDPFTKETRRYGQWGTGGGPKKLQAEFNERRHERGVLSAARSMDPNSASSQFFVCHANAPQLDRQYTAFGELVWGHEALDRIATTPRTPSNPSDPAADRPLEPQVLLEATVVVGPPASPAPDTTTPVGGDEPR